MKREIWRNYPVMEKAELVEGLLGRGILERRASRLQAAGALLRHRLRSARAAGDHAAEQSRA